MINYKVIGSNHQTANSESTNVVNKYVLWFLFQLANWGKKLFLTKKKFIFFFNCSNWENLVETIRETNWWQHLMKSTKSQSKKIDLGLLSSAIEFSFRRILTAVVACFWTAITSKLLVEKWVVFPHFWG